MEPVPTFIEPNFDGLQGQCPVCSHTIWLHQFTGEFGPGAPAQFAVKNTVAAPLRVRRFPKNPKTGDRGVYYERFQAAPQDYERLWRHFDARATSWLTFREAQERVERLGFYEEPAPPPELLANPANELAELYAQPSEPSSDDDYFHRAANERIERAMAEYESASGRRKDSHAKVLEDLLSNATSKYNGRRSCKGRCCVGVIERYDELLANLTGGTA